MIGCLFIANGGIETHPDLGRMKLNLHQMEPSIAFVDVYFSPEAPEGKESNWIPTGEDFFLLFRLYGPTSKDFYKTWMLEDVEKT